MEDNLHFLNQAIEKSKKSIELGGFPVGSVIVKDGEVIATAISNGKQLKDPTSHAEVAAIREACRKLQTRDLKGTVLYSSLEPCLMCYAASIWASIPKIVYACSRDMVAAQHFEGKHNLNDINAAAYHSLFLVHSTDLQKRALKVIEDWEKQVMHSSQGT